MHDSGPDAASRTDRFVVRPALVLATVLVFVWFVLAPDNWILAIPILVALPLLWRWQRLPLVGLLALELALFGVIRLIQATCAFDACTKMVNFQHPWHFLDDMAGMVVTFGPAMVLLVGLPGLVAWAKQTSTVSRLTRSWRGPVRRVLPMIAATLALMPVYFVAAVFAALGVLSVQGMLVILPLAIGVPLALSVWVGYVVRTWVPILVAFLAVAIKNAGAVEGCANAIECHMWFQVDPLAYPLATLVIGAGLIGAAAWGMKKKASREDLAPPQPATG